MYSSGLAEGAVVQSTGSVDDDTTVQFYSSSDCAPGTEISRGNGRCIALDHEAIGTYQSFKVTPLNALATRSTRSTPKQRRHPSRSPSPDGAFAPTPNIQHGMDISFDGEQYRLLQIYGNGYIGIPQHEWDDTIHIANNDELLPAFGRNTTVRALDERDLVRDLCGLATSCVTAVQNGVPQIRDAISPFIENLKTAARARGVQAVEFLQQPFFTQVALGEFSLGPGHLDMMPHVASSLTILCFRDYWRDCPFCRRRRDSSRGGCQNCR